MPTRSQLHDTIHEALFNQDGKYTTEEWHEFHERETHAILDALEADGILTVLLDQDVPEAPQPSAPEFRIGDKVTFFTPNDGLYPTGVKAKVTDIVDGEVQVSVKKSLRKDYDIGDGSWYLDSDFTAVVRVPVVEEGDRVFLPSGASRMIRDDLEESAVVTVTATDYTSGDGWQVGVFAEDDDSSNGWYRAKDVTRL